MTDQVNYSLPFGPLGDLVHRFLVRGELIRIFRHRGQVISAALRAPEVPSTGRVVAVAITKLAATTRARRPIFPPPRRIEAQRKPRQQRKTGRVVSL